MWCRTLPRVRAIRTMDRDRETITSTRARTWPQLLSTIRYWAPNRLIPQLRVHMPVRSPSKGELLGAVVRTAMWARAYAKRPTTSSPGRKVAGRCQITYSIRHLKLQQRSPRLTMRHNRWARTRTHLQTLWYLTSPIFLTSPTLQTSIRLKIHNSITVYSLTQRPSPNISCR